MGRVLRCQQIWLTGQERFQFILSPDNNKTETRKDFLECEQLTSAATENSTNHFIGYFFDDYVMVIPLQDQPSKHILFWFLLQMSDSKEGEDILWIFCD